jgi:TolB protein
MPLAASASSVTVAARGLLVYERYAPSGTEPGEIWTMSPAAGASQRRITRGCCFDLSSDGRKLVVLRPDGMYAIGVDGSGLRKIIGSAGCKKEPILTGNSCTPAGLDWSPDGHQIAISATDGIRVARADGTRVTRLTSGDDTFPSWAPNGRRLAFCRSVSSPVPAKRGNFVFVVNTDGSGLHRLTPTLGVGDCMPAWSPDGRRILVHAFVDVSHRLWVLNSDGSDRHLVGRYDAHDASWSPDGSRIVYVGPHYHLCTVGPDGSDQRDLTPGNRQGQADPRWSPDGRSIVFARASRYQYDIWKITDSGANIVNLTNTRRPVWERSPAWSR